jgi:hypothetical protein
MHSNSIYIASILLVTSNEERAKHLGVLKEAFDTLGTRKIGDMVENSGETLRILHKRLPWRKTKEIVETMNAILRAFPMDAEKWKAGWTALKRSLVRIPATATSPPPTTTSPTSLPLAPPPPTTEMIDERAMETSPPPQVKKITFGDSAKKYHKRLGLSENDFVLQRFETQWREHPETRGERGTLLRAWRLYVEEAFPGKRITSNQLLNATYNVKKRTLTMGSTVLKLKHKRLRRALKASYKEYPREWLFMSKQKTKIKNVNTLNQMFKRAMQYDDE